MLELKKRIPQCTSQKTAISSCELTLAGIVPFDQLLCCSACPNNSCLTNFSSCVTTDSLIQCHNVSSLPACQRTDNNAQEVCSEKDKIVCIGTRMSSSLVSAYPQIFEAYK